MPRNINNKKILKLFQNHAQCSDCFENCTKNSGTILCKLCNKWYHMQCQYGSKELLNEMHKKGQFYCEKCVASFMPFFVADEIDFLSALYGEGDQPCKKCKRDCINLMKYFYCYVCDERYHSTCTKYLDVVCSDKCLRSLLPFNNTETDILCQHGILTEHANSSSITDRPIKMKDRPHKCVPIEHFHDIDCSYLNPNELNDSYLGNHISDLSIFQGNVRSLNANFDSISEIFDKCQKMPDVLAITETKLKEDDDEPEKEGYEFERSRHINRLWRSWGVFIK